VNVIKYMVQNIFQAPNAPKPVLLKVLTMLPKAPIWLGTGTPTPHTLAPQCLGISISAHRFLGPLQEIFLTMPMLRMADTLFIDVHVYSCFFAFMF